MRTQKFDRVEEYSTAALLAKPNGGEANAQQAAPVEAASEPVLADSAWRGMFDEYRRAMRDATEASDAFHFSTLLVRAGMALGRRVWFDYGMGLYANFYCLSFGPTGDRKTTAQRYFAHLGSEPVKTICGAGSGEGLADEFQDLPAGTPCVLFLEEFTELLRRGR